VRQKIDPLAEQNGAYSLLSILRIILYWGNVLLFMADKPLTLKEAWRENWRAADAALLVFIGGMFLICGMFSFIFTYETFMARDYGFGLVALGFAIFVVFIGVYLISKYTKVHLDAKGKAFRQWISPEAWPKYYLVIGAVVAIVLILSLFFPSIIDAVRNPGPMKIFLGILGAIFFVVFMKKGGYLQ